LNVTGTTSLADGTVAVAELDIDGATDIGAGIADADLFVVDDGAGGTNRKTAASRLTTYILADNSIDSDMYVDGSIDAAHMSANSIDSASYVDGSIDTAHIANDQITAALMADNSIDSDAYVDGSIDTAHIGALQVTGAKLNTDVISAQTALTAEPADTDELLVSDAGVLKRVDYSYLKSTATTRPNVKPLIDNGDMVIAQRGASPAAATGLGQGEHGFYTVDRWKLTVNSSGGGTYQWTQTQESLTSGAAYTDGFSKAVKMDCTTADVTVEAADNTYHRQRIEGQNLQLLKKGTANAEKLTLAFWVKSTKTGTFIAELIDDDNTRGVSVAYTVSSTDTWEKKVLNFPADTTGVLTNDNGTSFAVNLWFSAGTNYTSGTLATAWASQTHANRAVGQVNCADSTSNNVHFTGVQLEVGEYTSSTIPPFQHESYGESLLRCERYYLSIADGSRHGWEPIGIGYCSNANRVYGVNILRPEMRATPSLVKTVGTNYMYILVDGSEDYNDNIELFSDVKTARTYSYKLDDNVSGCTTGQAVVVKIGNAAARVALSAEI
jgi:hypothetical protein